MSSNRVQHTAAAAAGGVAKLLLAGATTGVRLCGGMLPAREEEEIALPCHRPRVRRVCDTV